MAGSSSEDSGVGRSLEGLSNGQQRSGEALAEWRSSEQVENGITSTSPPYWDIDDDHDYGQKPSELFGRYTWKIDKFSQINKRELRSNAFEVGGHKWYILIYPQGCDVCNHLSLFLCVANHDKLLPGWSHFAQFTIAVVNKDPKKSKYSDTLHRFWKKEHDWGWKKFMELSKVLDGFVDADTLIIKAQVQVIRERPDRPFRCLDRQYRRELVRVYLSNVEQICRRFVEEKRGRFAKLIEDYARWSSLCNFWSGIDQISRLRMSREKSDSILKIVVKHFFIEKEVTSTLVMDSLHSGLKALEDQNKNNKIKGKCEAEEVPVVPLVQMESDMFLLVDDVLLLLERVANEPLPPKDEKGSQNRTKDGGSGEDFSKDSLERDERRLTELGRRTIEVFVLAHIFSSKIEVAYQEAISLKRQEELIREEEEAWMAEIEQKAKRASEKEKKSKKKQAKQKRNNRKLKDKGRDEKPGVVVEEKEKPRKQSPVEDDADLLKKPDALEDVSDVSDSVASKPFPQITAEKPVVDQPLTKPSMVHEAANAAQKPVVDQVLTKPVPPLSRPLSAPIVDGSKPNAASTAPAVSMVQTAPFLSRSASAAGYLGPDPSYGQLSYRNAMLGTSVVSQTHSHSYTQPVFPPQTPERIDTNTSIRPTFSFGMMNHETVLQNGSHWLEPESLSGTNRSQPQAMLADEFPHLDIINDLLDDEYTSTVGPGLSFHNGHRHLSYHEELQHSYGGGFDFDFSRDMIQPQANLRPYVNGQIDGLVQNQWQIGGSDLSYELRYHMAPDYYTLYPPSNGQ